MANIGGEAGKSGIGISVQGDVSLIYNLKEQLQFSKFFETTVQVGFGGVGAPYAIFVHENLQAYHKPPTKAKFLEDAYRNNLEWIFNFLAKSLKAQDKPRMAFYFTGSNFLRDKVMKFVPIDTGNLRRSKFIRIMNFPGGDVETAGDGGGGGDASGGE